MGLVTCVQSYEASENGAHSGEQQRVAHEVIGVPTCLFSEMLPQPSVISHVGGRAGNI